MNEYRPPDQRLHALDPDLQMFFQEVKDRVVRIETRMTRWMKEQNYDPGVDQPVWKDGEIDVPSPHCSLEALRSVVPDDWPDDKEIAVYCKDQFLLAFTRD